MTWNRRDVLASFGVAGAASLLWACSGASRIRATKIADSGEVRTWLRDAVARLATVYPTVHALAVSRRRTTAAVDVLGAGVSRARSDGAVLVVRDRDGHRREEFTSELSGDGVAAAVRALVGKGAIRPATIDFGREPNHPAPPPGIDPRKLDDRSLRVRAEAMAGGERSSRIVYAAGLIDIDDSTVWSIAPHRDLEQRLVRVRRTATRVAWNGTRPVVSEATIAWRGGIDDQALSPEQLEHASRGALELMTPVTFADGEYHVLLHPGVGASAIDAITRTLLTRTAMRRPEVAGRLAIGSMAAATAVTLVDDPTVPGAYGSFAFDDEGEPAVPITLLDQGRVADRLGVGRGRRPGHTGLVEIAPSHLRIATGTVANDKLIGDGVILEGARNAIVDPSSGRIVIAAARARELRSGQPTGRVFADVELVGDLAVLASVTATSSEVETVTYRDDHDGLPRWRSIETPWILARGTVRARRRRG